MRKHYMTICVMNNTEVTHIKRKNYLEVTFEQACSNGFKTLICDDSGNILSNDGFNNAEVVFFLDFLRRNIEVMKQESEGLL